MDEWNSILDTDQKKTGVPTERFVWRHNSQRNIKSNLKEDQVGESALPDNKIFYTAIFYSKWNRMQGETDSVMDEKKRNTQKQTHSIYKPDRGHDKSVG